MTSGRLRLPLAVTLLLALAACGNDHGAHTAATIAATSGTGEPRVVEVAMDDIRFDPTTLRVERGETIRLRFTNNGAIPHDALLGDAAAQTEHGEEMSAMSATTMEGMEGMDHTGHSDMAVTVDPGDTQTITYTFAEAGQIEIGCHQPGHYAAGMRIEIEIG